MFKTDKMQLPLILLSLFALIEYLWLFPLEVYHSSYMKQIPKSKKMVHFTYKWLSGGRTL